MIDEIVQCHACLCMVHPKTVTRNLRNGRIVRIVRTEYDCPKCGEKRIWEGPEIEDAQNPLLTIRKKEHKMKTYELASILHNLEYPLRITGETRQLAIDNGFVIVYGVSDDLMEIDGAIRDEISCYGGGYAYFTQDGLLENECDDYDCPYYKKMKERCKTIEAVWNEGGYAWTYKTKIPHEHFDIMEDGEKYCRGIVFSISDIK